MKKFPLTRTTLQTQLGQLNEKVRVYVGRLWQLPFIYLTVTGVFLLHDSFSSKPRAMTLISILLVILGILSVVATFHIHRRINETAADIAEVEEALSLNRTVAHWTRWMMAPYYAMLFIGIAANVAVPLIA